MVGGGALSSQLPVAVGPLPPGLAHGPLCLPNAGACP